MGLLDRLESNAPALSTVSFSARSETPIERDMRVKRELKRTDVEGDYVGGAVWDEISNPDGTTQPVIHFGNPYNDEASPIKTLKTVLTKDQFEEIRDGIVWTKETCKMIFLCADSYQQKMPLIIQGESSIGKSFCVNAFSYFLNGAGIEPVTFDCTGQSDVADLTAKPVPRTSGGASPADAAQFLDFIKSDFGQSQLKLATAQAESLPEASRAGFIANKFNELLRNAGVSTGSSSPFEIQWGAIPQAMTATKNSGTGETVYPEKGGDGTILHIQEITMAKPAVINILLALRGNGRQMAKKFTLWPDGGKVIHAGPKFWMVCSANPVDGSGFQDRQPLDKAFVRGCVLARLGDLCEESWGKMCRKMIGHKLGKPPTAGDNTYFEYQKNPDLVKLLSDVVKTFHLEYRSALKEDPEESEKEEKVMGSSDDIAQVARSLYNSQIVGGDGQVSMVETLRHALKSTYLERHLVPDDEDEAEKCFRARMETAIDTLIDSTDTSSFSYKGKDMSCSDAIKAIMDEQALPPAAKLKKAQASLDDTLDDMPDDLKNALGF